MTMMYDFTFINIYVFLFEKKKGLINEGSEEMFDISVQPDNDKINKHNVILRTYRNQEVPLM